jgi:hypothetical protein
MSLTLTLTLTSGCCNRYLYSEVVPALIIRVSGRVRVRVRVRVSGRDRARDPIRVQRGSEVVPALGTPPMMKCGKQMYSWLENRRRQRGSSRAFALPAAGGCSAPG